MCVKNTLIGNICRVMLCARNLNLTIKPELEIRRRK